MTRSNVYSYGLLGLPLAFVALPVYVHLPRYYAESFGMELALIGFILLVARLLDAVVDPWFGWFSDRVNLRRMVGVAVIPLAAGFVALLNPPEHMLTLWLLLSLAVTYIGFSAMTVAYQAWGVNAGDSPGARTQLVASREGFGLLGVMLAAALPSILSSDFSEGVRRLSWILPPLLFFTFVITYTGSRFREDQPVARASWMRSSRSLFTDVVFQKLLIVFVVNGIAAALPATLFLFFVADVLDASAQSGFLLALYFMAGAVSLSGWVMVATRFGRARTWFLSMLLAMCAFSGTALLDSGDLWPFAMICLASGFALGADLSLPAAMAAEVGERHQKAGACFGIWNFFAKLNLALAAGISLPLLSMLGYTPGNTQALGALIFVYALIPLVFKFLAALLLWRWRNYLEMS